MTRRELVAALSGFDPAKAESEWEKDVIVDVGRGPEYLDVVGLGEPNEDTVVLVVKVGEAP